MEGAGGSHSAKNINRRVIRNAQILFDVLHEKSLSPKDRYQQVSELLSGVDVDVNVPDEYDYRNTLLHGAVNYDFVDVVKLLLENDAEINIRNAQGETPLHIAVIRGYVKIVQMLLEKGADVNIKNAEGETPLHIAVAYGSVNIALMILKNQEGAKEQKLDFDFPKVDVNIQNAKGETPLHLVFSERRINRNKFGKPIVQMLLKCQGDVNIQNNDGKTPLDLAKETKKLNIIATFEQKKNISLPDEVNHCHNDNLSRADTSKVEENDRKYPIELVTDPFASSPKTYASSGAKKSMHGTIYQLCLLMLFAIRAIVQRYRFHLGTEVDEAEQFDDLVFKYQCPNTHKLKSLFLQAKSKANAAKGIGLDELLEEGNKAQFSLLKYYKSYVKIRNSKGQEADEIDFSICTNTHFNFSEPGVLIGNGKKLSFKIVTNTFGDFFKEGICYKLHMDEESLDWLKNDFEEKLKREIICLKGKDSKELNAILSNLNDTYKTECGTFRCFLKNLVFVVGQTADIELVKTEFRDYSKTKRVDTDLLTDAFYKQMFDWSSKKEGEWLANDKVEEMIGIISEKVNTFASSISQVYAEKLLTSPIKFNMSALEELHQRISVNTIVNLITPVETKLTLLQVAQVLEHYPSYKTQDSFIFVHLKSLLLCESQERIIQAFESPRNNDLLVIDCLSKEDDVIPAELTTLRDKLCEITANNDRKKLILIAPVNHALAETFTSHHGYYSQNVKHIFEDFTKETQDMLLATWVTFQGQRIKLSQVIDETDKELLAIVPLESLISDEGLVIGTEIPICTGYNESYYIDRFVRYQTVIKADLFDDLSYDNFNDELATTELEFQQLCAIHPKNNIHLIEKQGGRFIWVKSQGGLSALRPYIDNDNTQACSEDFFLDSVKLQRVVIISDSAGMGKSTVLDHISKKIKANCQGMLVLRIDLNKHTKVLKKQNKILFNNISAKKFLLELFMMTTPLERSFLEHIGKAVMMFDGFDAISPDYKEVVLDLIHNLKEATKAQIWITTRPFMREKLENYLHQFAYTLQPFSQKNQEDFVIKYWKHMKDIRNVDEGGIRAFALSLIEELSASINDKKREFTEIPLQIKMLSEFFFEDFEKKNDFYSFKIGFNLVDLYEKITRLKFDVYQTKFYGIEASRVGSKQSQTFNMCMKQHRWYALSVIFPEEKVNLLCSNSKRINSLHEIESNLNKIGIVSITNGVPHFIHRSFAEYVVALFCMKLLTKVDRLKPEVKDCIIADFLISDNFPIIRSFLNGLLATSKFWYKPIASFSIDFVENKTRLIEKIFLQTSEHQNLHINLCLLGCVQTHQETWRELLLCEHISEKNILHLGAKNNDIILINKFLNWIRGNMENCQEILNQMLLSTDINGDTALLIAAKHGNATMIKSLLIWTRDNMYQGQDKVEQMLLTVDNLGRTVLQVASGRGYYDSVQTVLQWTRENIAKGQEVVKQMLLSADQYGYTALTQASVTGRSDIVQTLLQWPRDNMDQGQDIVKQMLLSADSKGFTVILRASMKGNNNVLQLLLKWSLDKMDKSQEEIKQILLSADNSGNAALLLAACNRNADVEQALLKWTCDDLDQSQNVVKRMIIPTDKCNGASLNCESCKERKYVVKTFLQRARDNMDKGQELVKQMLRSADNDGDTSLLVASLQGNNDVLQTLLQWTKEYMDQDQNIMKKILLLADYNDLTAVYIASRRASYDLIQTLLKWTRGNMDQGHNIVRHMLQSADNNVISALTSSLVQGSNAMGQKFQQSAPDDMEKCKDLVKQMLLITDNNGVTALLAAAWLVNDDVALALLQWARNNIDQGQDLVKQMILSSDNEGLTALLAASVDGNDGVVRTLLQWTRDNMDQGQDIVKQMLLLANLEGVTLLMVATERGNMNLIETLLQWTLDNLDEGQEVVKQMLLSTDDKGSTALQAALVQKNNDVVKRLLQWTNDKMERGQVILKQMLLSADNNLVTPLLTALKQRDYNVVEFLLQWTRDNMNHGQEIVKQMLQSPDKWGVTPLYMASKGVDYDGVELLLQWTRNNMDQGQEIVQQILLLTDRKSLTALMAASFMGNNNVVLWLLEWIRDNLEQGQVVLMQILVSAVKNGWTALLAAAYKGHNDVVQTLLQWTCDNLDQGQEVVKLMLLSGNEVGSTPLLMASALGKIDVLYTLLQWTRDNMDHSQELLKQMLLLGDNVGSTVLLGASLNGENDVVQTLLQWTRDNMDHSQELLKQMLLLSDNEGSTVLMGAVLNDNYYVVQTLLQWTRDNMDHSQDVVKQMLLSANIKGHTLLITASFQENICLVLTLLEWTRDNMDQYQEIVTLMLLSADNNGNTPLSIAYFKENDDLVQTLLHWTRDNLDQGQDIVQQLIISAINEG